MQKNTLFFLLLVISIFLLAPTNKAKAVETFYGCKNNDTGVCQNVAASNPPEARSRCLDICLKLFPGESNTKCQNLETLTDPPAPCPLPAQLSCTKNNKECKNLVSKYNDADAEVECADFCGADNTSCIINLTPCPSTEPSAGASVGDLKSQAQSSLNKANFSGPADLINRAIKILMAFIGSIALVLYIYSGFLWMTASGNAEQAGKAKTTIVWTTLGVLMMLASYMLASFLFKSLGL